MKKSLLILSLVASMISLASCNGNTENQDARTIKVWMNEGNNYDGKKKDSVWQKIEEKTNVTLEITGTTHGSSYYQALSPTLNSKKNDIDIVFSVPSNKDCGYESWIDQDMFWNIDELLTAKPGQYKNISNIIHNDVYKNITYGDNFHSIIPFLTSRNGWAIYYRSDWLINIGYYTEVEGVKIPKTPVTMDEFEDVLKKFTNKNQGTYGLSPAGNYFYLNPLYHAFGVTPDFDLDVNNNPTYMYTQPEFKNFLSWISKMYKEGYIDPSFASNKANEGDRDKFYNGVSGILITNGETHIEYITEGIEKVQGKNKFCIGTAPIGTASLGKQGCSGFSDWGGWWGGFSIFKHMNGNQYDYDSAYAALDLLDYLYSEEGGLLRMYGIEGTHWDYDGNGNIVPNLDNRNEEPDGTFISVEDANGIKEYSGLYKMGFGFGNRAIWHEDNSFDVYVDDSNIPERNKSLFKETVDKNTIMTSRLVNFTGFATGFSKQINKFKNEMDRYATQVTMGNEDVANWDQEMALLDSTYQWDKIRDMISEQLRKGGII